MSVYRLVAFTMVAILVFGRSSSAQQTISLNKTATAQALNLSVSPSSPVKTLSIITQGSGSVILTFKVNTNQKLRVSGEGYISENSHPSVSAAFPVANRDSRIYQVRIEDTTSGNIRCEATFIPDTVRFRLTKLSHRTFVASDTIKLEAATSPPKAGVNVRWTVTAGGAASGITGFPKDIFSKTDATGIARFSFRPADNPLLVSNRRSVWTKGSRVINSAMFFDITATANVDGKSITDTASKSLVSFAYQDEIDVLRQEYFDYNVSIPARESVLPTLGYGFNKGNYQYQLSNGLDKRFNAILASYRGRSVTFRYGDATYQSTIPMNATIGISSAYRNPQRNKNVGSLHPNSKHTQGRAFDLFPISVKVTIVVNGQTVRVDLPTHTALYPALHAAAGTQGSAIAEDGATRVRVGDTREDHIHVQW